MSDYFEGGQSIPYRALALWDAATALRDLVEKAKSIPGWAIIDGIKANTPIIEAIEARWGKDVWDRHRRLP
jgi:hypothetical protein